MFKLAVFGAVGYEFLMKAHIQKSLTLAVIASEGMHIFCCVLPTIFSLMGLLAGVGVVTALPPSMIAFHEVMHKWEIPMIAMSGIVLLLGWAATWYADKIDCHSTGCAHGACAPKKTKAHKILMVASVLFVVNVVIYTTVHRSNWFANGVGAQLMHRHHDNNHGDVQKPQQ